MTIPRVISCATDLAGAACASLLDLLWPAEDPLVAAAVLRGHMAADALAVAEEDDEVTPSYYCPCDVCATWPAAPTSPAPVPPVQGAEGSPASTPPDAGDQPLRPTSELLTDAANWLDNDVFEHELESMSTWSLSRELIIELRERAVMFEAVEQDPT